MAKQPAKQHSHQILSLGKTVKWLFATQLMIKQFLTASNWWFYMLSRVYTPKNQERFWKDAEGPSMFEPLIGLGFFSYQPSDSHALV